MEPYRYFPGTVPVVVSIPHSGTFVPQGILERFTPAAKQLRDTDWHVDRLYDFVHDMGIHMIAATHSRYVIDLNRDPGDISLYPGQFTTGLCPTTLFDGSPLYLPGHEPAEGEVVQRTKDYWQPYHAQLQSLLAGLKQQYGRVVLFDAHSIASQVPTLFEGKLPDLNIGTNGGLTADGGLVDALMDICEESPYSYVLNGRFKGGYITRHYGNPEKDIHAVQLELAQCNYMKEGYPFEYLSHESEKLRSVLGAMLSTLTEWALH